MKHPHLRLLPAALVLCLALTACGGGEDTQAYDPAATAQALLDSDAFTEALSEIDQDTAVLLYGLDPESVTGSAVYGSLSSGAEEIAVLTLTDEAAAQTALEALEQRVADQRLALESYQPGEVSKLDSAILDQRGNSALLVVAADAGAAQAVLDGLDG